MSEKWTHWSEICEKVTSPLVETRTYDFYSLDRRVTTPEEISLGILLATSPKCPLGFVTQLLNDFPRHFRDFSKSFENSFNNIDTNSFKKATGENHGKIFKGISLSSLKKVSQNFQNYCRIGRSERNCKKKRYRKS